MPVDSVYCNDTATEKHLVLDFDEGDDILACIESAMRENDVKEARVVGVNGRIKSGSGMYLLKNNMRTKHFTDTPIKTAAGHFKLSGSGLFGALKVIPADLREHVTVARTFASDGFRLRLSYYALEKPGASAPQEAAVPSGAPVLEIPPGFVPPADIPSPEVPPLGAEAGSSADATLVD